MPSSSSWQIQVFQGWGHFSIPLWCYMHSHSCRCPGGLSVPPAHLHRSGKQGSVVDSCGVKKTNCSSVTYSRLNTEDREHPLLNSLGFLQSQCWTEWPSCGGHSDHSAAAQALRAEQGSCFVRYWSSGVAPGPASVTHSACAARLLTYRAWSY